MFSQKGTIYTNSKAILFIIRQLPYAKWVGVLFHIIPTFILDHLYDRIAKTDIDGLESKTHVRCKLMIDSFDKTDESFVFLILQQNKPK